MKVPPDPAEMAAELRIFPLGDSITDGGATTRAYRYHMHVELSRERRPVRWLGSMQGVYDRETGRKATSGTPQPDVADWPLEAQHHEGHWGWTSMEILLGHRKQPQRRSLTQWLEDLASSPPNIVTLHIGTNDLTKYVVKQGKPVSSLSSHVSSILQRLCQAVPEATVLVASLIPYCRGGEADIRQRREIEAEYNGRLSRLRRRHTVNPPEACPRMRLQLVNLTAVVTCSMLVDGIHPGPEGARRMAAAFLGAIRSQPGRRLDEYPLLQNATAHAL
jgi:lysophospholipase L1-like esterase